MPISKKPKEKSEAKVQAIIKKGGSSTEKKNKKDIVPVTLRLPLELSDRIDSVLEERVLKTPRHTWLLEAIIEKLEKEESRKH